MKSNLSLLRRNDWNPFYRLQDELDRMMNELVPAKLEGDSRLTFIPDCDIEETQDAYHLSFDLPGVRREDLQISIEGNVLEVSGERNASREEKSQSTYVRERSFGKFRRSFQLPNQVESSKIEANYDNGVLHIFVPKSESLKARKIEVRDGSSNFLRDASGKKKEQAA